MKAVAIGCGIALLLLFVAVGIAVWQAPKLFKMFGDMMEHEAERQQLAARWQLPADDAPADAIFPPQLAAYTRTAADDDAKIPDLAIDVAGKHAVYQNGPSRIDAYVYQVTPLEGEALLKRIEEQSEGSGTRTWSKINMGESYSRVYVWTSRLKQNHIWLVRGRLIVFRTADEGDREPVVLEFFRQGAQPPAAKPDPEDHVPPKKKPAAEDAEPKAKERNAARSRPRRDARRFATAAA